MLAGSNFDSWKSSRDSIRKERKIEQKVNPTKESRLFLVTIELLDIKRKNRRGGQYRKGSKTRGNAEF